ncbi:MAG: GNAT family N-acetyltransferase [Chloroflexi bacterium]|nr:GNAT family N-acetyltransferase [Chloroflexota bacterium]
MSNNVLMQIEIPDAPAIPGLVFRHFRGETDYPAMVDVTNEVCRADGVDWVETIEKIANQYQHLDNCDPYRDVLMVEVEGQLVGYGRCWWLEDLEGTRLYFHFANLLPAWRGRGIRQAMLTYNERHLQTLAQTQVASGQHSPEMSRVFFCWANETETDWKALLAAAGYAPARYFADMVRPTLNNIPHYPLPSHIEIRRGMLAEWRQIWEAAAEAFRDHWGEVEWSEEDFLKEGGDPTFNPDLWQIAWDGDEVAGGILNFIDVTENEKHGRQRGYTETVFVRQPWRGQGIAKVLFSGSFQVLQAAGMTEAALGVDADSPTGAFHLYESMGFKAVKQSAIYRKPLEVEDGS